MRKLLKQDYIISATSAGAVKGDRHCSLLHLTWALYFISSNREFSRALTVVFFISFLKKNSPER
jgi:hypothetical protein